jgi:uncharacterized protein YbjQ (UPF0145 family)
MTPGEDADAAARSLVLIEQGGLPPAATSRLQENAARQNTPQHLFTSNLSVNEFVLTHQCGYEPLGQVMGTSVYHVGFQWMPGQSWGYTDPMTGLPYSQELGVVTAAYIDARERAFGRLRQEAALLHADGVVGVRFERIAGDLPAGTFEFKAVGTAVRRRNAPPSQGDVFVSNLNGQDHWMLRSAGMKPIGFVFGTCCWYQVSGWRNQMVDGGGGWGGSWANRELPDFTQGMYNARELAHERMETEARQLGARGVVGVVIDPEMEFIEAGSNNSRRDLIIKFTIFGTAIDWDVSHMPDLRIAPTVPLSDPT